MVGTATALNCPHCGMGLFRHTADYICQNRHTFPIAREGYVSLLGSTHAGDTVPMLAARRRVLDAGYFLPIAKTLADAFVQHAPLHVYPTLPNAIIDAGCGEGSYLGYLQQALAAALPAPLTYYGFDSAKAAVKLAARRYRAATFFVGDIRQPWHLSTGSSCAILNIFAPRNYVESARVLQQHGLLLSIIPTQRHLHEVRDVYQLLAIEQHKEARVRTQAQPWFAHIQTHTVEYRVHLQPSAIADMVRMSPSSWHQRQPIRCLNEQATRSVTVSVHVMLFQRV